MVPCSLWHLSLLTPHSLETLNLLWPWFSSYLSNCFFSTSFAGPSSSTHFRWPLSSFYKLSMNNLIAPIILINTQTAGDSQLLILRPDLPTDLLSSNCLQGSSVSMSNRHLILNTPDTELTIFPLNTLLFLCSSSLHVASSSTCHSPEQTGSRLRALPPPSSTSAPLLSLCVWLRQHSFLGRSEVIFSVLSSNPYYSSDFDQWSNALDSSSKLSLNFFFIPNTTNEAFITFYLALCLRLLNCSYALITNLNTDRKKFQSTAWGPSWREHDSILLKGKKSSVVEDSHWPQAGFQIPSAYDSILSLTILCIYCLAQDSLTLLVLFSLCVLAPSAIPSIVMALSEPIPAPFSITHKKSRTYIKIYPRPSLPSLPLSP